MRLSRPRTKIAAAAVPAGGHTGSWPGWFADRLDLARFRLRAWLEAELAARRLFLWTPVAMALGVALYFAAEGEPSPVAPLAACGLFAGAALLMRNRPFAGRLFVFLGLVALGFTAAKLRTLTVQAPRIERVLIGKLEGLVEQIDFRASGARLIVRPFAIEGLAADALPRRVRLVARERPRIAAGDPIAVRARLMPPPEPVRPGGYDFSRDAFYRGIGGVGSALGGFEKSALTTAPDISLRIAAAIDRSRNELTDRIAGVIGGQAGALAAALVTGKRDLLTEPTNEALRAAGVYHIVSVSGLHMVLAAGIFFFIARMGLALLLEQHTRLPIKKIAAAVAMAGAAAYCLFTGSEVATERSLIMILVLLGAILVDRTPLSMRNLALAAILVLLLQPETVIGPSFQMSFAAVAGLIAYAEWSRARQPGGDELVATILPLRVANRLVLALKLILITTAVASLATAPFAAFHFQRLNPLGLIGNALALPIVSLIVMPAATLGVVAYPFGLDRYVWQTMGLGVEPILSVSAWVAGFRGAVAHAPAFGTGALILLSFAIVWFVIWRTPLRFAALLPLLLGLGLARLPERPDLLVARNGSGAALRAADGRWLIVGRPSRFDIDDWLRADGDARRGDDASLRKGVACDAEACVARREDGSALSVVRRASALAEDCRRAAILITSLQAPDHCRPAILVDRERLAREGALSLTMAGGRPIWRSARHADRRRPWEPKLAETRNITPPSAAERPSQEPPPIASASDRQSDDSPIEP